MQSFQTLQALLAHVENEIASLKQQGLITYPAPFILDRSTANGKIYYRKRDRNVDGSPGQSTQISEAQYTQLREKLARGRAMHKLEKRQATLVARLEAIATTVNQMGGIIPDESDRSRQ